MAGTLRSTIVDCPGFTTWTSAIPLDLKHPWSGFVIDSEPDTGVEMMAHIALTSLCGDHLTATAVLPITLLLIRN
jgi:hypothetical protein